MSEKRNFLGSSLTKDDLNKMSTTELVRLYNAKATKKVTSTPTKSKFVPRLWDLYADEPAKGEKPAKAAKGEKPAKEKKERQRLALDFAATVPADQRKQANRGSHMETLLTMASRANGVTEQEFKSASKAKDRFRAMVMWANEGLGWGFKEIEPGRVALVDGAGHRVEYTPREAKDAE